MNELMVCVYYCLLVCLFTGRFLSLGLRQSDAAIIPLLKDSTTVSSTICFLTRKYSPVFIFHDVINNCHPCQLNQIIFRLFTYNKYLRIFCMNVYLILNTTTFLWLDGKFYLISRLVWVVSFFYIYLKKQQKTAFFFFLFMTISLICQSMIKDDMSAHCYPRAPLLSHNVN